MKSVIAAAVLFLFCVLFCIGNTVYITSVIDDMDAVLCTLSDDADVNDTLMQVEQIMASWSSAMPYLVYVCGYAVLNRADEAVWELYAYTSAGEESDALAARYKLADALRRLRVLEGISFDSVF